MGRPPLGVKYTAIRLSPEMLAAIDARAGVGHRSEYIRIAVAEKLAREGSDDPRQESASAAKLLKRLVPVT